MSFRLRQKRTKEQKSVISVNKRPATLANATMGGAHKLPGPTLDGVLLLESVFISWIFAAWPFAYICSRGGKA